MGRCAIENPIRLSSDSAADVHHCALDTDADIAERLPVKGTQALGPGMAGPVANQTESGSTSDPALEDHQASPRHRNAFLVRKHFRQNSGPRCPKRAILAQFYKISMCRAFFLRVRPPFVA